MKKQKGFTLVELAIVLVIIGIILGAVLKGQDLIQNARAKQFVNKAKAWEVAQWTFYDRYGRFAGDQNKSGLIGDDNNDNAKTDLTTANFKSPPYEYDNNNNPVNTLTVGGYVFYVFYGYDTANNKNIIALCRASDCNTTFNNDDLVYVNSLDISIDGTANGQAGNVVCSQSITNPSTETWIGTFGGTSANCDTNAKAVIIYF
ncbi:prepilin-type N-terminal cleavage/methylation domain-containing protein [Persephonella sp.]